MLSADNVSRHLSIRRLGSTGLTDNNQMRYGLVKGDGFIEVWAFQRAFINGAKVAVLAQTARTELYIPDGFVKQTAAPSGYIEGNVVRIYDQVNKPTKADLGLSNAMLTGAFGLGGSGLVLDGKMTDKELLQELRAKGGCFWRSGKPTGSESTIFSHGSGIFSRCGDTWSAINIDYESGRVKIYSSNDNRLNNGTFNINELYGTKYKPSKSDVGLSNVTNDAQVKKPAILCQVICRSLKQHLHYTCVQKVEPPMYGSKMRISRNAALFLRLQILIRLAKFTSGLKTQKVNQVVILLFVTTGW
ncbi:hypothetical protein ABVN74_24385 [Escherichia coli]